MHSHGRLKWQSCWIGEHCRTRKVSVPLFLCISFFCPRDALTRPLHNDRAPFIHWYNRSSTQKKCPNVFPFHTFRTGTLPRSWCHAAAPMLACEQRGRKVSCVVVTRRLLFTARGNVREKSSRPPRPEKRNCRGTCGAEFHISNLPLIGLQNRPTRIQNRSTFACDFQGYVPTVRNEQ